MGERFLRVVAVLRLLHTSDWHFGKEWETIHADRRHERARFADALVTLVRERAVDLVIVAGDVYHTAAPPNDARADLFDALTRLTEARPGLTTIVIAGNHDSPAWIDAPRAFARGAGVHFVGTPPLLHAGGNPDDLIVPVRDGSGAVAAYVCAVPFLRPGDLERPAETEPAGAGVRRYYDRVRATAAARRDREAPGAALVAVGHLTAVGADDETLTSTSERTLYGGVDAVPADIFAPFAYTALGHLHRAQRVGGHEHVRYSGAPMPMALDEADYPHQVVYVELDGDRAVTIEPVRLPRTVDIVSIGRPGAPVALEAALAAVNVDFPAAADAPARDTWPLARVYVRLPGPDPTARERIQDAARERALRVADIQFTLPGNGRADAAAELEPAAVLGDPVKLFTEWLDKRGDDGDRDALVALFAEITADALRAGDDR